MNKIFLNPNLCCYSFILLQNDIDRKMYVVSVLLCTFKSLTYIRPLVYFKYVYSYLILVVSYFVLFFFCEFKNFHTSNVDIGFIH